MKKTGSIISILFLSLLVGCSVAGEKEDKLKEEKTNERKTEIESIKTNTGTPTTAPNTMPYAVFYNDQLYLYKGGMDLDSIDQSKMTLLGEITDSVSGAELPSINFQTNISCLLPTPLFSYQEEGTLLLVMEVNYIHPLYTGEQEYNHSYYIFYIDE